MRMLLLPLGVELAGARARALPTAVSPVGTFFARVAGTKGVGGRVEGEATVQASA